MRRKILACLLLIIVLLTAAFAEAQQPAKVVRLAYFIPGSGTATPERREAFLQGLRDHGYVEGKNLVIEYRYAEGKAERLQEQAAQIISLKPDVIFTGSPQAVLAVKALTTTIPIVFAAVGDPVGFGVVASLAKPGGNITGIANLTPELSGKRLELLKESVPNMTSVAVLWNPASQGHPKILKVIEEAASALRVKVHSLAVRSREDFNGAFQSATKSRVEASCRSATH